MDEDFDVEELKRLRKIHGDISSSDDDSDPDYSKAEFDELYEKHRPAPIIIDPKKHKIIEIHAPVMVNSPTKGLSYAQVLRKSSTETRGSTPDSGLLQNDVETLSKRQWKRQKRAVRKAAKATVQVGPTVSNDSSESGVLKFEAGVEQNGGAVTMYGGSYDKTGVLKFGDNYDAGVEEIDQNDNVTTVVSDLQQNGVEKLSRSQRKSLKKAEQNEGPMLDMANIQQTDENLDEHNETKQEPNKPKIKVPVEGCILTYVHNNHPHIQYYNYSNLQSVGNSGTTNSKGNVPTNPMLLYVYTYITNYCGNLFASFANSLHQAVDSYPVDSLKVFTTTELFLRNLVVLTKQFNLNFNVEHFKRTRCTCVILTNITNLYSTFTIQYKQRQLNYCNSNLLPTTVGLFLLDVSKAISSAVVEHKCEPDFAFDKNKYPIENFIDQNLSSILVNLIDKVVSNIVAILIQKQVEFETRQSLESAVPAVVEDFALNQKFVTFAAYYSTSYHLQKRQKKDVPVRQDNVQNENKSGAHNKNSEGVQVATQNLLNSAVIEDLTENRKYFYDAYFESNAQSWRGFQNSYLNSKKPKSAKLKLNEADNCELNSSMKSIEESIPLSGTQSRESSQTLLNSVLIEDLTENRKYFYNAYFESNAQSWCSFQNSYLNSGESSYISKSKKSKRILNEVPNVTEKTLEHSALIEDLTQSRKYFYDDTYFESNAQSWRDFQNSYLNLAESQYIYDSEKPNLSCEEPFADISELDVSSVEYPLIWLTRSCNIENVFGFLVFLLVLKKIVPLLLYFVVSFLLSYVDVAICVLLLIYFCILFVTKF